MKVGIIGGGLAGLAAAYRLSNKGHEVTILERWPDVGGQASTFLLQGEPLERFYHHIFTNDVDLLDLCEELGVIDKLDWLTSIMGFYYGGHAYHFGTPKTLLRFSALSIADRIRFGVLVLFLQRYTNWRNLENVTAASWVRRYAGPRIFKVVWGPLLRGKFGDRAEDVSMTWLWGKIHLRGKSRSKGMQSERLGYMRGSFQVLVDALRKAIVSRGGQVLTNISVDSVRRAEDNQVRVGALGTESGSRQEFTFDRVVATIPSFAFAEMTPELPEDYRRQLLSVKYQSALCLVLELDRRVSDIYWMNVADADIPFVGVIEHTNFIPSSRYGNKTVFYVTNYLSKTDPLYALSKEELLATYMPHLRKIRRDFDPSWVHNSWLFREDAGQPIVTTGYSKGIPSHQTPLPGVYLANTTQIYPEDRGMNYSIKMGLKVADLIDRA